MARAILRWLQATQIETAFIDPGKPWQNGTDESFNGKLRDQHLSLQWFRNRADAKVSIEAWRRHYNEVRPHSSLAYLTPAAFKAKHLSDVDGGRSPAMPARAVLQYQYGRGQISSVATSQTRRMNVLQVVHFPSGGLV